MRVLALLLAPLLLSGCALLAPTLGPPPAGAVEHDGYLLVCEDVPTAECERRARAALRDFDPGPDDFVIRWVIIRPEGEHEICWDSPRGSGCHAGTVLSVGG